MNTGETNMNRTRLVVLTLAGLAVLALIALISYAPWDDDTVAELRATRAILATIIAAVIL
jgi:hypothetical protein